GTPDTLKLGNVFGGPGGAINGLFTDIGHTSVFFAATLPTTITDDAGHFDIGATDASVLDAHGASQLAMFLPDTGGGVGGTLFNAENIFLNHGVTVTGGTEAGATNLLQGSSGPLQITTQGPLGAIGAVQAFIGGIAQDIITGGAGGGDNI